MREICTSGSMSGVWKRSMAVGYLRHIRGNPDTEVSRSLNHRATPRLYRSSNDRLRYSGEGLPLVSSVVDCLGQAALGEHGLGQPGQEDADFVQQRNCFRNTKLATEPRATTPYSPSLVLRFSSRRKHQSDGVHNHTLNRKSLYIARATRTPEQGTSGTHPSSRRTLIIFRLSVLQDGTGIINRSGRLSDEEKFPGEQIIIRPQGEAVPERENVSGLPDRPRKRFRGWEAAGRLAPTAREDGLRPCLNNPESRSDAAYGSPVATMVSPYAPTERLHNGDEPLFDDIASLIKIAAQWSTTGDGIHAADDSDHRDLGRGQLRRTHSGVLGHRPRHSAPIISGRVYPRVAICAGNAPLRAGMSRTALLSWRDCCCSERIWAERQFEIPAR